MINFLVGLHAGLGELGSILFLWVAIELFNPDSKRINRSSKIAFIGFILLLISWLIAGIYYTTDYGANIKPVIKESSNAWAHNVIMESKEHIFILLPFLSFVTFLLLRNYQKELLKDHKYRKSLVFLSILIFLIGLSMAFLGYLISSAYRAALEVKVI